jgi:hypothetical protein
MGLKFLKFELPVIVMVYEIHSNEIWNLTRKRIVEEEL